MSVAEVGLECEAAEAETSAVAACQNVVPSGSLGCHV